MMDDVNGLSLKAMCDKCFKTLRKTEKEFGFVAVDDSGEERLFKGHEECVIEIARTMSQLYGKKEENEAIEEA